MKYLVRSGIECLVFVVRLLGWCLTDVSGRSHISLSDYQACVCFASLAPKTQNGVRYPAAVAVKGCHIVHYGPRAVEVRFSPRILFSEGLLLFVSLCFGP